MAAIIYSGLSGIEPPKLDLSNHTQYQKECDKYINDLKAACRKGGTDPCIGEVVSFPVADSCAEYMVCSMSPLELIHIKTMDEWQSEFAELLTPKKVREMVNSKKNT